MVLCVAMTVTVFAQRRKTGSQLRALAVVEFPETGKPRLIPVTILVNDRYYDAGVYKASPVPMSLEPGTVYEARKAGEPAGLFVVTTPAQLRRNWIAAGGFWIASFPLGFHRVTRHDGVLSVLRGYTRDELSNAVFSAVGVRPVVHQRLGFRITTSWVPVDRES